MHAFAADTRLMTHAEYKSFLNEVDAKLPQWEAALKKVDPAESEISYAMGEKIVQYRDPALAEVGHARQWVAKQRVKRTVSGELAPSGFLRGVFDGIDTVVSMEISAGVTLSKLETFTPEVSKLVISISNGVTARVELLEGATCP